MTDERTEKLLIKSVYSDKNAQGFFMEHLSDKALFQNILTIIEESDSGDARMKGAYYVSKFDEALLRDAEDRLLVMMDDEWDSVAVHIMVALSRIRSKRALEKMLDKRVKPVLHWEAVALKNYFD